VAQGIAFSPDGTYVATANSNGTVSLVDVVGRRKLGEPITTTLPVGIYSPNGSLIAAPGADGSVTLLDADNGREVRRLTAPSARPLDPTLPMPPGLAFSSDGTNLAYGGMSGKVTIFDTATGAVLQTLTPPTPTTSRPLFPGAESLVGPLAFSPDDFKLVVASLETGTIFDLRSGRQIGHPAGWTTLATNTFFTPDGAHVVVSGFDLETLIFDPDTGDQVGSAIADASIAVNGPSGTLLTTNHSGTIRIIDLATREPVGPPMAGLNVPIGPMFPLPGGTEIIASYVTGDGLQIFDVTTGEPIGDPFPSQAPYAAASVSPDGKSLIAFGDTHLMRWNIDQDTWANTACEAAGRNLTRDECTRYLPNGGPYQTTCPDYPP
jgi:WD40 repeat protein